MEIVKKAHKRNKTIKVKLVYDEGVWWVQSNNSKTKFPATDYEIALWQEILYLRDKANIENDIEVSYIHNQFPETKEEKPKHNWYEKAHLIEDRLYQYLLENNENGINHEGLSSLSRRFDVGHFAIRHALEDLKQKGLIKDIIIIGNHNTQIVLREKI